MGSTERGSQRFLTTVEAARVLRISPHTLENLRWRKAGPPFLRATGTRGRILYEMPSLLSWLRNRSSALENLETRDADFVPVN